MPNKKKVLFLSPYPIHKAPSQRLKYEQYFDYFEANGYSLETRSFINERLWKVIYKKGHFLEKTLLVMLAYFRRVGDLFSLRNYDIVYVHLWVTPFGFPLFEALVCALSKKVIYDIDDLIFLGNKHSVQKIVGALKGRTKPIYLMRHADHVITCTPYLDAYARKYTQKTTDISSTINTETYVPVNTYANSAPLVIGWSGSHSTSRYLKLLENVLIRLREKYSFKVLVIGAPQFRFDQLEADNIPWVEHTEVADLQKIDIGLYPLPLDEEWVFGKSGLKALQYMALGVPTVATGIGANFRVIEEGVSGYLVKSEDEWFAALEKLLLNAELRKSIGAKARERVEKYYSIHANRDTYLDILNKLSER